MNRSLSCILIAIPLALLLLRSPSAAERKTKPTLKSGKVVLEATPVDAIQTLPGFKVERLYSVPAGEQGSWVAMTTDDKGRLIASDQNGGLYRITPPALGASAAETKVEHLAIDIEGAQGLLYAFHSLYMVGNGRIGSEHHSGLYRAADDGHDGFGKVELLRQIDGAGGEHGPHAIVLGPDGKSLYVVAGNFTKIPNPETSRAPRVWGEDQLLPRMPDGNGFATNIFAPAGWVARTDPDGKAWELHAIGMRNCYDIAFNADGELFTYDNDMEWDINLPWYRPTRVSHLTSGSDSGWRNGSGKFPVYYPDNLPPVVDIGLGAPTGIAFGYGTKFPAKYQQALYILDWTYGVIYAVHMEADGSTYKGTFERFVSGQPLPVTDIVVGHDGALYFTIGGRKTQSGLYRVTYTGSESTELAKPAVDPAADEARALRRRLEAFHGHADPQAVDTAFAYLGHADRFVRWAARTAIESQPVAEWQDRALAQKDSESLITAMVALARCGDKSLEPKMLQALGRVSWEGLSEAQRFELLRAYELTFARMGKPAAEAAKEVIARFDPLYPAGHMSLNRELGALLAYLEAPDAIGKTLHLLTTSPVEQEQIWCAYILRSVSNGWTLDQRRQFFEWFPKAASFKGGHSFAAYIRHMKEETIKQLSDADKKSLAAVMVDKPAVANTPVFPPRKFVKRYTIDELLPVVQGGLKARNFARGRQLFAEANCYKCHRFNEEGGSGGPDLTGVRGRFNAHDLLESIIDPSKVIADQYKATRFTMDDGRVVVGRITNFSGDGIHVTPDLMNPDAQMVLNRKHIESMEPSSISPMPTGLLDTLTQDEALDLVAFLLSGGDKHNKMFIEYRDAGKPTFK